MLAANKMAERENTSHSLILHFGSRIALKANVCTELGYANSVSGLLVGWQWPLGYSEWPLGYSDETALEAQPQLRRLDNGDPVRIVPPLFFFVKITNEAALKFVRVSYCGICPTMLSRFPDIQ